MGNETYKERVEQAKKDLSTLDGKMWDNVIEMWRMGYSLRVISEVMNISRSKLQRFIAENGEEKIDDPRSQIRNKKVHQAGKLYKMGFTMDEIATEMGLNRRTIESYFRQLGIKTSTKFGEG